MMELNYNISDGADKLMSQWCQKELIMKGESSDKHTNGSDGSWLGLQLIPLIVPGTADWSCSLKRNLCVATK